MVLFVHFLAFILFFHYFPLHIQTQGQIKAPVLPFCISSLPAVWSLTPGARWCHSNPPMVSTYSHSPFPQSSGCTFRKHLREQTDSGNRGPITPPRQQHEYNKHVIKPASKNPPQSPPPASAQPHSSTNSPERAI